VPHTTKASIALSSAPEIELQIRSLLAAQDYREAAVCALDRLGPDVLRFLSARLTDRAEAERAYLQFSEDLWVGLPAFRWESSLRTWMFVLARNAAMRSSRKRQREGDASRLAGFDQFREHVRISTVRHLRTAVKDRMRKIRERLQDDDQTLLILRVDQRLDWRELAVVMNEVSAEAPEPDVTRAMERLRERFRRARAALRALAESEGLFPPKG
jgi:RNA polymerase sigma-70 factor (ECF subfamily)